MAYSKNWDSVDFFHVLQAAWLWCDKNPEPHIGSVALTLFPLPEDVAAVHQMLGGAIRRSDLPADHSGNPDFYPRLQPIPRDLMKSEVTRSDLIVFAKSKNQFPPFLFDTMGPTTEQDVTVTVQPSRNLDTPETKKKGGRPLEYDWDGAMIEILRIADEDSLPKTQADLVRAVISWFRATYDKEPAESEVKRRVSAIYKALAARGWKPND